MSEAEITEHLAAADAALALAGHHASAESEELARRVGRGELTIDEAVELTRRRIQGDS
ncbi:MULTISPECIES: hypothetical protein [Agromyces]|uniref:hypothetical protein n=1 Tax=Agromyces TaxID=33877 RepID=UPI00203BBF6B|nr:MULTISPECIES: hypothetical protein [Agromyces]MCM3658206.1 hypothetical protein [Agromyces mediolanus]